MKQTTKKQKLVSATQLRKTLSQCVFNPRQPGPMKVVTQMDNPEYWMLRSVEETMKAQDIFKWETDEADREKLLKHLEQAIQLLGLAKAKLTL